MENQIGKYKFILGLFRILLVIELCLLAIWIFFSVFFFNYNRHLRFFYDSATILPVLFWFLPSTLRWIMIIKKNLKLENYVYLEKTFKWEVINFLVFPMIAGIVMVLGEKTSLFEKNAVMNIIGSSLLVFSLLGYLMLLIIRGMKVLLLHKSIRMRILGIILSSIFLISIFVLFSIN
jgi:hypothetical protein